MAFPTESFPCVGRQLSLGKQDPAVEVAGLIAEAELGHCDLVAKGSSSATPAGWVYDRDLSAFLPDSSRDGVVDVAALRDAVPPGEMVTRERGCTRWMRPSPRASVRERGVEVDGEARGLEPGADTCRAP